MTRIAVVGSREFPLMDAVSLYIHQELDESYVVVSGAESAKCQESDGF